MTQCEIILDHLLRGERISTLMMYDQHKITTCGQRVTDLKKDGWEIHSEKAKDGPHHEYFLLHCTGCTDGQLFGAHQSGTMEHPVVKKKEAA